MAQSGNGRIRLFNDFAGLNNTVSLSVDLGQAGDFYCGGEGFEDNDAGLASKDGLSGVVTLTSANADTDTTFIGTRIMFDVALMAPLTLETRIQIPDFDTKEIFFGLTSVLAIDEQLEDIVQNASGTTVTLPADLVGFYLSDEISADDEAWHGIHSGGTTAASTTVAGVCLGGTGDATSVGPDVNDWQILRLEVASDGTTTWWVDGVLYQTVTAACSTTTNLAACLAVAANTTEFVIMDCDYIEVTANRDWTV